MATSLVTTLVNQTSSNINKMSKNQEKKSKKVLLIVQELKMARALAGNNKTVRDRALKGLRKWLKTRPATIPFTEDDFLRIWKGLFYSMWMSDKPLIQEECAENISQLIHCPPPEFAMLFFQCGIKTLMNEWFGIDQLRLDKFLMFVRRLLRQALIVLRNENWTKNSINKFTQVLSATILNPTTTQKPMGLFMHFTEIYLEELAKISKGKLKSDLLTIFLIPFIEQLILSNDGRQIGHIRFYIFTYLIRQSNLGLDYQEKYQAWRQSGFPGTIDSMQKVECVSNGSGGGVGDSGGSDDDDGGEVEKDQEEDEEKPLDPRAGRVDVELPQIQFNSKLIIQALMKYKFAEGSNVKSRRVLVSIAEQFKKLSSGSYPFKTKKVRDLDSADKTNVRKAVNRLVKFDKKMMGGTMKTKKRKNLDSNKPSSDEQNKKIKLDNNCNEDTPLRKKVKNRKYSGGIIESNKNSKIKYIFRRNSGTWFVFGDQETNDEDSIIITTTPSKSDANLGNFIEKELESISNKPAKSSKLKKKKKKKKEDPNNKKKSELLLNNKRKNPNRKHSLNNSVTKKIRINTTLNRSQDVHEHQAQILSSPHIPYNADKKPTKPILKPTGSSPINPFYSV